MLKVNKFSEFILEKKLYIFQRRFRIKSLLESSIYDESIIRNWMEIYNFDEYALCMFVTLEPTKNRPFSNASDDIEEEQIEYKKRWDIRISSKDIKNKDYFDAPELLKIGELENNKHNFNGYLIEDSKLNDNGSEIYLFVFIRNSNDSQRARQNHGFVYESNLIKLNKLNSMPNPDKWDAYGSLDKRFLNKRFPADIKYFNGTEYISTINENGLDVDFSLVDNKLKRDLYWNIKCIRKGGSIDMGDFKRISGLEFIDGSLQRIYDDKVKGFILAIGFHDGIGNIIEEYIIYIDLDIWKSYLPDLSEGSEAFDMLNNMYNELLNYKLKVIGNVQKSWEDYRSEFSLITQDYPIKLRFKKDSKGQLRIQCAINYSIFKKIILENPHIKIISN
jgi:hypothetical protein